MGEVIVSHRFPLGLQLISLQALQFAIQLTFPAALKKGARSGNLDLPQLSGGYAYQASGTQIRPSLAALRVRTVSQAITSVVTPRSPVPNQSKPAAPVSSW